MIRSNHFIIIDVYITHTIKSSWSFSNDNCASFRWIVNQNYSFVPITNTLMIYKINYHIRLRWVSFWITWGSNKTTITIHIWWFTQSSSNHSHTLLWNVMRSLLSIIPQPSRYRFSLLKILVLIWNVFQIRFLRLCSCLHTRTPIKRLGSKFPTAPM